GRLVGVLLVDEDVVGQAALTGGQGGEGEGERRWIGLVEEVNVVIVEGLVALPLGAAALDQQGDRLVAESVGGREVPGAAGAGAGVGVGRAAVAEDAFGRDEGVAPTGLAAADRDVVAYELLPASIGIALAGRWSASSGVPRNFGSQVAWV